MPETFSKPYGELHLNDEIVTSYNGRPARGRIVFIEREGDRVRLRMLIMRGDRDRGSVVSTFMAAAIAAVYPRDEAAIDCTPMVEITPEPVIDQLEPALEPEPEAIAKPKTEKRTTKQIRAAIEATLVEFEQAGRPFTAMEFCEAAGIGNARLYTAAYADLKDRVLDLRDRLNPDGPQLTPLELTRARLIEAEQRNRELRQQLAELQSQQAIAPAAEQATDLIGALRAEAVRWERQISKYHVQIGELGADLKAAEENLSAVNRLLAIHESEVVKPASNGHHAHTVLSKP